MIATAETVAPGAYRPIAAATRSADRDLSTSREEIRSLDEDPTARDGRLRETPERHRLASNDLQNVLHSTDGAILFLDVDLAIRFFTPAARALFGIVSDDVGRPLADLRFLDRDDALLTDAHGDGRPDADRARGRNIRRSPVPPPGPALSHPRRSHRRGGRHLRRRHRRAPHLRCARRRRCGATVRIEVWDTGIGIPEGDLQANFVEYHQIDNAARDRSRGLGLGLSIVQRLGICSAIGSASVRARAVNGASCPLE